MEHDDHEAALAARAAAGDHDALALLVERVRLTLFAAAYRELAHYEDAQDAVANALLRICTHAGSLRDPGRARAWMRTIVVNEARRLRTRRAEAGAGLDEGSTDHAEAARLAHLRIDIERALRRLPADQARAVALHYLAGLPVGQIAARTGRPEGTVKAWLHYGRRTLADQLRGYEPMTPSTRTAAIVSTNLDAETVRTLSEALQGGGFANVKHISDYGSVARLDQTGEGENAEVHICEPLKGVSFVVLDGMIAGRSAFELLAILRATAELGRMATGLLLDGSDPEATPSAITAAWASGIDLCLTKPVDPAEFRAFANHIRKSLDEDGK